MLFTSIAAADPIFYLHHGWLDSLWWAWQIRHGGATFWDMGGVADANPSPHSREADHELVLSVLGMIPSVTIGQVMDATSQWSCTVYPELDALVAQEGWMEA